ncbi:MAG: response regulator transcription factor [Acidobacteria bacterium]|nr:response regulator transcription factor [Acidobacteriota bacterium]
MPIRIAIADDHAVFRSGLRALLEKETDMAVVAEAGTGFDAIKMASENDPDVLILDISLPGLPGPRVAEMVLQTRPRMAVVVLTMHEDAYYMQELFRIGARGYVLKKSTGTDLIQAIRAAHRGEQYIDPAVASHVISTFVGREPRKKGRLDILSRREREICGLLAMGHTNTEISRLLSISERTVETHRANIMAKLDLRSRAELVRFAIDNGLMKLG